MLRSVAVVAEPAPTTKSPAVTMDWMAPSTCAPLG